MGIAIVFVVMMIAICAISLLFIKKYNDKILSTLSSSKDLKKEISKNKSKKIIINKDNFKRMFISDGAYKLYASLACILAGLILGLIILICMNPSNAFYEFFVMLSGNVLNGGPSAIKNLFAILAKTAPLICVGLSVIFSYKSGMFNIGVAGQYVIGMFGALIFALQFKCPWYVCLLMSFVFGAIYGSIPGLLKAKFNVNEVISGIMLNWIALFFVNYSFQTYLKGCVDIRQGMKTYRITSFNPSAKLPDLGLSSQLGSYFTIAIFIAILLAIVCWFILSKTTLGYQLKASGFNKDATKYAGMKEKRNIVISMAISGALAAVGAALYYLADLEQWQAQLSNSLPALPWNGIVVAFLAQINPIGVIFASLFTAWISHGAGFMTQIIFPNEISSLITGIIVYFSGLTIFAIRIFKNIRQKRFNKKQKKIVKEGK